MPPRRRRHYPRNRPAPRGPWKHGAIPVIGVVGGIGAGKSTVSAAFAELGAFVIDADAVGHALLTQRPVRECIIEEFGPAILGRPPEDQPDAPWEIDRHALGAIVFADPSARKALEAILHPRMRATFAKAIGRTVRRGQARAVVIDAAILYEAGWDSLCDHVVFVDAPREVRLERLAAQRGWDEATLAARESAQRPLPEKRDRADAIVAHTDTDKPLALREEVDRVWAELVGPERGPRTAPEARSGPTSAHVR